ncbi:MAG: hypothetical protein JWN17_1414 [Frankiales bacterium]|nr:hypothetical protein [Frankiales bacterium]
MIRSGDDPVADVVDLLAPTLPADLTTCDREPIHLSEAIQPHGVLLAARGSDLSVVRVSANSADHLGLAPAALLGSPLSVALGSEVVGRLRSVLEDPASSGTDPVVCHPPGRGAYELTWFRVGETVVVELEPAADHEPVFVSLLFSDLRQAMTAIDTATGVTELCDRAATAMKELTSYDRVMVYRFHADEHGEVVAEQCEPDQEAFLGLHYPASDIPRQARTLYLLNHLRVIADVGYAPSPLVCTADDAAEPLDLSQSGLRSVSPLHVAYLQNMGVGATLAVSLFRGTRLWGMVVCHHRTPKRIDAQMRAACRVLGQLFSLQLVALEHLEHHAYRLQLAEVETALVARMTTASSLSDALAAPGPSPVDLTGADGMVARLDGQTVTVGAVPPPDAVERLLDELRVDEDAAMFVCHDLAGRFPAMAPHRGVAAGVIALPLSAHYVDHVLWFRGETVHEDRWGGDPDKAMTRSPASGPDGLEVLTPRLSFDSYRRQVHGQCRPWHSAEVAAAAALAVGIPDLLLTRARDHFAHLAMHDQLTGLPNRALLLDHTSLALAREPREPGGTALLFIDLDRFKLVNDSLGHDAGDDLLRQAAARLVVLNRATDTVARIGGDEFIVLCERVTPALAAQIADRIVVAFQQPFVLGGGEAVVTASIGWALAGRDTSSAELLRDADTAMYRVKRSGRNAVTPFTAEMRDLKVRRTEIEVGLRPALEDRELVLHYQPLHSIDGRLCGFEALARWPLPGRGMVPPAEFIPVAEAVGVIGHLTAWALDEGLGDLATWRQQHPDLDLALSVNVTAAEMASDELLDSIDASLARLRLPPSALCIELTEGALVTDDDQKLAFLTALRERGVRLSIDDFGTGFSALSYLTQLPVDELKIDRSFITGLPTVKANVVVVAAIVSLGHQLGLQVLAEGVETVEELATLRRLGCDLVQGYLLGRPMPARDVGRYLEGLVPV